MSSEVHGLTRVPLWEAAAATAAAVASALVVGVGVSIFTPLMMATLLGMALVTALVRVAPIGSVIAIAATRASAEGMSTVEAFEVAGFALSIPDAINVAFLIGASWWLVAYARRGGRLRSLPVAVPFLVFLVVIVLSLGYSSTPISGFKDVMKLCSAVIASGLIVAASPTRRQILMILGAIVVGSLHPIALGFWHFATSTGFEFASHGGLRVLSVFTHPNHFGTYLVVVLAAAWGLRSNLDGPGRRVVDGISLLSFVVLILTLSRSAWLVAAALIVAVGWRNRKILLAGAVASGAVVLFMPRVLGRVLNVLEVSGEGASSTAIRLEIWSFAFPYWLNEPILGHGWGAFLALSDGIYAHNDYLRVLLETGVVGLAAFLFFMFSLVKHAWVAGRGSSGLMRAFFGLAVGYALLGLVTNNLDKLVFQWYFWTLAGAAFAYSHLSTDRDAVAEKEGAGT